MDELKKEEVMRLENLEVKEVSLVGRPANKRTFAIVKSEEGVPATEPPAPVAQETTKTEAIEVTKPATPEKAEAPSDPHVSPAAEAFQGLHPSLASALPRVAPLAKRFEAVIEGITSGRFNNGDLGVKNFAGEVSAVGIELTQLASSIDPARPTGNNYAIQLAETQKQAVADDAVLDEISKAGAKMAKERLARMKDAVTVLLQLIEELTQEDSALPGVFTNAEKATAPVTPEPVAQQTATPSATDKQVAALTEELAALKKANAERDEMLMRLAKSRDASNAIPVNGTPNPSVQFESPVTWSFDLNSNVGRGDVRKEHTFAIPANGKEQ